MTPYLPLEFYLRQDVVAISKELLGKWIFTQIGKGPVTGGMIIETEAYAGAEDRACHAYGNRRTPRTEVMFQKGGVAYVYLCYGMHHLLNVVTNQQDIPHAILIRAIKPTHGIETMLKRRKKTTFDSRLTSGPGALCQALGIDRTFNGYSFASPPLWIEDRKASFRENEILATPRIGVDYAGKDAHLPWRFLVDPSMLNI
jgi:DNA-3-methyladenine glycosylase